MTSRDFCYWLQVYFEVEGIDPQWGIPADKAATIQRHLALVFAHDIDPKAGDQEEQDKLNAIHHSSDPNVKMRC